jgi:hypothetical protein
MGAAFGRLGGQLLGQPGLADAGLAGHQHHPTGAGGSGLQVGDERRQLGLAAHKRRRHRGPPPSLNRTRSATRQGTEQVGHSGRIRAEVRDC